MFNRFMLCIALGIQSSFALTHAANDLEKWNSESGKVARSAMREKLKTTTYRELPNHVDSSYRSTANGGKVLRQIETNATVKGSRVGTTIEALKDVDKMGAAKKWAKELGKGGLRFTVGAVLIEAAMQEMLDGIGWVMDEGGKIQRLPSPSDSEIKNCGNGELCTDLHSMWNSQIHGKFSTPACLMFYPSSKVSYNDERDTAFCLEPMGGDKWGQVHRFDRVGNPFYDPENVQQPEQVLEPEMIEKIRDYFENPQAPASKDLLIEDAVKPKGKAKIAWSDDPDSEQTIYNDNKNTTDKVLQSDDPVSEGLTKDIPKINDGTQVDGETTPKPDPNPNPDPNPPNPNPDPNPSNPDYGSTFNFKLPAFCDWASVVCDWLDWTKEGPEKEEEQEQETINDKGIFDREFDIKFEFEKSCPPDYVFNFETKYIAGSYKFTFNWLCMFFSGISYPLVFLSHCLGAWIFYEIAVRRGNQGA